jgi:hypothetical protein
VLQRGVSVAIARGAWEEQFTVAHTHGQLSKLFSSIQYLHDAFPAVALAFVPSLPLLGESVPSQYRLAVGGADLISRASDRSSPESGSDMAWQWGGDGGGDDDDEEVGVAVHVVYCVLHVV